MDRKTIIAGNWKMYKTNLEAKSFIEELAPLVKSSRSMVYLAVPFTALAAANSASQNTNIIIGAQNMHSEKEGAFTGEISGSMLKTIGAEFVILGHSERRHIFKEEDAFINKKVIKALQDGLQPILCIGETEEQREKKETNKIIEHQIKKGLEDISKQDMNKIVVAYEPVWAIGTGKTATPEIAQEAHLFIRKVLSDLFDKKVAKSISILYGGSVKPNNIEQLISQKDIDGALVGGASLEVDSFSKIVNGS